MITIPWTVFGRFTMPEESATIVQRRYVEAVNRGMALERERFWKGAIEVYDAALKEFPFDRLLIARRDGALFEAGLDEAVRFHDDAATIRQVQCGLNTRQWAAIVRDVCDHSSLAWNRDGYATRGGYQTTHLSDATALGASFETLLWRLCGDYAHDTLDFAPDALRRQCRLIVWGVKLALGGFQEPHNHPDGVISGVLYPALDAQTRDVAQPSAARLVFTVSPHRIRPTPQPFELTVIPEPGAAVLFPSHLWHFTTANAADRERLSIAFDLVPGGQLAP